MSVCKDGVLSASLMRFVFEFMLCMVLNLICLLVSENGSMREMCFFQMSQIWRNYIFSVIN